MIRAGTDLLGFFTDCNNLSKSSSDIGCRRCFVDCCDGSGVVIFCTPSEVGVGFVSNIILSPLRRVAISISAFFDDGVICDGIGVDFNRMSFFKSWSVFLT